MASKELFLKLTEASKTLRWELARTREFSDADPHRQVFQLAQAVERLDLFRDFAASLAPCAEQARTASIFPAREFLRRSGYYHRVHREEVDADWWSRFEGLAVEAPREVSTLVLLEGCSFPVKQFRLLERDVVRLDAQEIASLGPTGEVRESFCPQEGLDGAWFHEYWWLTFSQSLRAGPWSFWLRFYDDIVLDDCASALTALLLFRITSFRIPIVLLSQRGWSMQRIRFEDPYIESHGGQDDEEPVEGVPHWHGVNTAEWSQFERFIGFCAPLLTAGKTRRPLRVACRRYLRASLTTMPNGDAAFSDDREDVVLQYVYGLESLLLDGDHEALADKLASRVALLLGEDDAERRRLRDLTKSAYAWRSKVAHGGEPEGELDVVALRDVLRRCIVAVLGLHSAKLNVPETLRDLAVSQGAFAEVRRAVDPALALVMDAEAY